MKINVYPELPVLIVDDEDHFLNSAELILASNGITNARTCNNSKDALSLIEKEIFSLVTLDINMPYLSGTELLTKIKERTPETPVIMITAINDVDKAVNCIKAGAFDYIVKPVDDSRLTTTIRRGLNLSEIRDENKKLKQYLLEDKLHYPEAFSKIITQSQPMLAILKYIEAIAKTPLPVLITGETGTGKELIAESIHKISGRAGELVKVNIAGVDDMFFSDTLFGHKKGAFTNAELERNGLIEKASDGTLFLDEIGDLNMESQVKLLRLLQDNTYYQLGSDTIKSTNARVIVATNRTSKELSEGSKFRKDLYYRLMTHHINIPGLAERKADIPILTEHFLEKAAKELGKKKPTPPKALFTLLENYNFPGNIRELEAMVYDAVNLHEKGILSLRTFKNKTGLSLNDNSYPEPNSESEQSIAFPTDKLPTLNETEWSLIEEALKRTKGNQSLAAGLLGITRRALNNRLQRSKKK
jgi:DNA-binding NtrC family response regulator